MEAASEIRRLAGRPGVAPGVPAILGCLETALEHLAETAGDLERAVGDAVSDDGPRVEPSRRHIALGFANLEQGLRDARALAAAARALSARVLERSGRATGIRR